MLGNKYQVFWLPSEDTCIRGWKKSQQSFGGLPPLVIFQGPVVWSMPRHSHQSKGLFLLFATPTTKTEAQGLIGHFGFRKQHFIVLGNTALSH